MKKTGLLIALSAMAIACGAGIVHAHEGSNSQIQQAKADGDTVVSDWAGLKSAVKSAQENDTIVLNGDVTCSGGESDRIVIDGKKLTIDLAGHKLSRGREKEGSSSDGHAIEIQGNSDVSIVSSGSRGVITGGHAKRGGAVNIHDGSKASFSNIKFSDNKASVDGGAIYNRGELTLNNCELRANAADDTGGAIYVTDEGSFSITGTTIADNVAKNDGGAMNVHLGKNSTITSSTITNNKSSTEDGGAISLDADDDLTLSIVGGEMNINKSAGDGGAIEVENGKLNINGTIFRSNEASKDGGAIFSEEGLEIASADFDGNKATKSGGAIRLKGDESTIENTEFDCNEATEDYGGAIYLGNNGILALNGGDFQENYAGTSGGAIFFDKDANRLSVKGKLIVKSNIASVGPDFFLDYGKKLTVDGALDGSHIGVEIDGMFGSFTTGFATNNGAQPSNYFFGKTDAFAVTLVDGEAKLVENTPAVDSKLNFPFISRGQDVSALPSSVNGSNWLSAISGERRLNEFNIPGTHDTSMENVEISAGALSTGGFADDYAITQKRFIPDQYEEGVRIVDIRLNNRYPIYHWYRSNEMKDDGENLWMCHGKKAGGTYYPAGPDGKLINLMKVLDWTREFLERNPSEFIIMGFTDEAYYESYWPLINDRLHDILANYIAKHPTNKSTGESLWYLEDGDLMKEYSYMPQLKDVRGKILFEPGDINTIGGFHNITNVRVSENSNATITKESQDTSYKVWWDEKLASLKRFYDASGHNIDLPSGGEEWDNKGKLYRIGLNCAPQNSTTTAPEKTPLYHSDRLLPKLFDEEGGVFYDIRGRYVGWINTDGATGKEWSKIYRSNFYERTGDSVASEDPVKIAVDPNLGDGYNTKEYGVYAGTEITIPNFNYDHTDGTDGKYFGGWNDGATTYFPGEKVTVNANMTFKAVWANTTLDQVIVPIKAVFHDCNNVDNIRPDSVQVRINGSQPVTLSAANSWKDTYQGAISTIELVNAANFTADTDTGYKCERSGDISTGYTFTFTHTSPIRLDFMGSSTLSGQIEWDDEGNYNNERPNPSDLRVGIAKRTANGTFEFLDDHSVEPTQNADLDKWDYSSIPSDLPKYENGREVTYRLQVKKVSGGSFANYSFAVSGNNIIATNHPEKIAINVNVRFNDAFKMGNTNRPSQLEVHISGVYVENEKNKEEHLLDGIIEPEDVSGLSAEEQQAAWNEPWTANYFVNLNSPAEKVNDKRVPYSSFKLTITAVGGGDVPNYKTDQAIVQDSSDQVTFNVRLDQLEAAGDLEQVESVIQEIENLSTNVQYTAAYKATLDTAKAHYDALGDDRKFVYNISKLNSLIEEYDTKFAKLMAIDATVVTMNSFLFNTPFAHLSDAIRSLKESVDGLSEEERNSLRSISTYNSMIARIELLENVSSAIDAIGEVTATSECANKIATAKAAYKALSPENQALVHNADELFAAEAKYFALDFLAKTGEVCVQPGDHSEGLTAIWDGLKNSWKDLSSEAQALLKAAEAEDCYADFLARYELIVRRYHLTEFDATLTSSGTTLPETRAPLSIEAGGTALTAIIAFAGVSLLGLGALALRRKNGKD